MKKPIYFIMAIVACVTFTACDSITEISDKTSDTFSDIKLVRTGSSDRIGFENLETLEKACDIAVVGEFINETTQDITFEYRDHFEKEIVTNAKSYNTIIVKNVLMGDINVGDNITIGQRYGIVDGELITFSDMTPMQKGDEWIFFLRKQSGTDIYWCFGDKDARYPTKNSAEKNSRMSFAPDYQLGVYDEKDFNEKVYNEIVEKYDV